MRIVISLLFLINLILSAFEGKSTYYTKSLDKKVEYSKRHKENSSFFKKPKKNLKDIGLIEKYKN